MSTAPILFYIFGVSGAGLIGFKMNSRTKGLTEFEFHKSKIDFPLMSVHICIPGVLKEEEDKGRCSFGIRENEDSFEVSNYSLKLYSESESNLLKSRDVVSLVDHILRLMEESKEKLEPVKEKRKHNFNFKSEPKKNETETMPNLSELEIKNENFTTEKSEILEENLQFEENENIEWKWDELMPNTEQYLLVWETKLLVKIGKSVKSALKSVSLSAFQNYLKYTTLAAVVTAVAIPAALVSLSNMIDSDWTMACERADKAGILLADILLSKKQGSRPVNLIGYSFGARLIFSCLREMTRRHKMYESSLFGTDSDGSSVKSGRFSFRKDNSDYGPCSAAGIIENAVLLGTPLGVSPKEWDYVSKVVHGRLINGYSKGDGILGLIYRIKRLDYKVAGLQEIGTENVENVDLSGIVKQHMHYTTKVPEILKEIGLEETVYKM